MSIARSGTPFQAHNATAATTAAVTFPSSAAAGSLGIIVAFWNTTGSWGATPSGWTVVPNSTQATAAPACIAYYKIVTASDQGASVTITGPASALNSVCAFAYTGTQGFDANAEQRNAASTTVTAPAVTAVGLADMLVMVGGAASGAATLSAPTNGLSLWQATGNTTTGIADKQLSASGSTSTSAMTIAVSTANGGIQFTLFQLDSDGEGASSSGARRLPMRGWNRASQCGVTGRDEELLAAALTDDSWSVSAPHFKPLRGALARPIAGEDEQPFVAAITDEACRPPASRFRAFRVRNLTGDEPLGAPTADEASATAVRLIRRFHTLGAAPDEKPFVAPMTDENIGRPAVKYFSRFRQSRAGDEQQALVTAPADEPAVARVRRLRAFRPRNQSADDWRTIVDDAAPRRRVRLTPLRVPAGAAPGA